MRAEGGRDHAGTRRVSPARACERSLVLFGGTGALARKNLFPLLFTAGGPRRLPRRVGAIRDIRQNLLLEGVGLLAMEPPVCSDADALRDEGCACWRWTGRAWSAASKPISTAQVVSRTNANGEPSAKAA